MKTIVRSIAIYAFTLFLLPGLIPGVHISGGLLTFILGGVVLAFLFLIIKPILSIISFPLNMVTLGVFNIFLNSLLLYLLTVFVTEINITAFTYQAMHLWGLSTSAITLNTFFAYLYTAFMLSLVDGFIMWMVT